MRSRRLKSVVKDALISPNLSHLQVAIPVVICR